MASAEPAKRGIRLEASDAVGFIPGVGTPFLLTRLSGERGRRANAEEGMKAVALHQFRQKTGTTRDGKPVTMDDHRLANLDRVVAKMDSARSINGPKASEGNSTGRPLFPGLPPSEIRRLNYQAVKRGGRRYV